MNGLNGIKGLTGLGSLPSEYSKLITENKSVLENIYRRVAGTGLNGFCCLGNTAVEKSNKIDENNGKTMSFDEVFKLYNQGISKEEVQAWVWYKRSQGIPMNGWGKFFLKGDGGTNEQLVVTVKDTVIKDNHFRDIKNMPKGTILGKYLKTHTYDNSYKYFIYRSLDNTLHYVNASDCQISKQSSAASESELKRLVMAGALYYLDGELLPLPIYAYGNMYDRELQLAKDKDSILQNYGKEVYSKHEELVKASKPEILTITSPDPKMRPIITAISDFAKDTELFSIKLVRDEYMDVNKYDQFKKVNGQTQRKARKERIDIDFDGEKAYSLTTVFCAWLYSLNTDTDFKKSSAIDIVDYYIYNKPLRDDKMSSEAKTELKANARNEGEELFARFLNEVLTYEDQQKLDFVWNRMYNGYSDINYLKIPIAFECSTRFKSGILMLTEAQRQGVAFMEAVGSGINAFDVGVGKTMTAIANIATNLYSGKSKRALVVVPKPTYDKWIAEIIGVEKNENGKKTFIHGVLSNTGVKLNDWFNLGTDTVKSLNLNKPVPENSITLVTYEGFKKIGFGSNVSSDLVDELISILGQSNEKTARDKEIDYQKIREMIGTGQKGTIADIDKLGFDYIVIDEAHRCKNVFAMVKADENNDKRYNITGSTSEIGIKAFFITNYLQRKFGRNVMLLTATPFTNSPLEIYSMLSHVAHDSFQKNNIKNLDTFMDLFVLPTIEWTANYKEEIVEKEVIKSFNNRILLSRLIYNHIHYKTGEEAGVKRPCKINIPLLYEKKKAKTVRLNSEKQVLTYLNMTPAQRENQNKIVGALQVATAGKLDQALLFRALNASLDNALSPYLFKGYGRPEDYKEFVDNSPKIKYICDCIKSVKEWHEERKEPVSGQIIYMNRGKDFFNLIKEYLEKEVGFKRGVMFEKTRLDEVEILTSEITETRKENVKEAFLAGVVKVIIGTATIREGIDLQRNGTVIYNGYPEWNPTDIRQLEGRIWRQGNNFGYVRIVMPLVSDSMDVFVFQKLEEKTSRINDIWFKGNRGNVLDIESLDPQEIKLALITDTSRLVRIFFEQELKELERDCNRARNAIEQTQQIQVDIKRYEYYKAESIKKVDYAYSNFKSRDFFTDPEVAERRYTKEQLKSANSMLDTFVEFMESSTKDDKEILNVWRKYQASGYGYTPYEVNYFKEYVSKVRKTERNILKPKGYDINSNLDEVLERLYKEYADVVRKSINYINDDEIVNKLKDATEREFSNIRINYEQYMKKGEGSPRWIALGKEIKEKKSALNVVGKTPSERAKEFAKLNYLLEYKMDDVDPLSCEIPDFNSDDELLLAELEAEAILILLMLQN